MTDGFRTAGSDPLPSAQYAATKNIVIHTVSFGSSFNQSELIAIASATGGKHYHAPDAATLTAVFREIALTTSVMLTQ
jgi:secreted protein with Ig-like and vWFA domain